MANNPNNAIGTNGAFGGRTSVNAFNDVMGALSRGVLSGWACVPNSGLTVSLGGDGTTRDVAIAEDNAGNKTSINNISNSPVDVTIGAAPGANSRIDSIVAYVDNPPTGNDAETDNPDACGLIVVEGTPASTPSPANDSAIRTAITADGASGTTAYYVVLAYITMANGTTDITSGEISEGEFAQIGNSQIADNAVGGNNIDTHGFTSTNLGGIASITISNAGSDTTMYLYRIGNLVFVAGTFVSTGIGTYDQVLINPTVPSGYRPSVSMINNNENGFYVPFTCSMDSGSGGWTIGTDGKIWFSNGTGFSGSKRFFYNSLYITDDTWPV